jgi:hypothetical protein
VAEDTVLKKGDIVNWRDSWGTAAIELVRVTDITVTDEPGEKYGRTVNWVGWKMVQDNLVIVGLERQSGGMNKWAYSYQIAPEGQDPRTYHHQPLYKEGWY